VIQITDDVCCLSHWLYVDFLWGCGLRDLSAAIRGVGAAMTTFTGWFSSPSGGNPYTSGKITLNLAVDAGGGLYTKHVSDHITGTGSISNYLLTANGNSGFPHTGSSDGNNIYDGSVYGPGIDDSWYIMGDAIRFDGSAQGTTGNGLSLDGTTITGVVTIYPNGAPGPVTATATLSGPALPTLYNLAEMSSYIEGGMPAVPAGWRPENHSAGSYHAGVFYNSDNSQIVIDVVGQSDDLYADLSFFSPLGPTAAFRQYVTSTSELLAEVHANNPDAHITLTGYSLGGAVVQLIGNASHYSTVAFDAPGAMQLDSALQAEMKAAQLIGDSNDNRESNVDIRVVGDGFSLVNEDDTIGLMTLDTDFHLYPDGETHILQNHSLDVVLAALLEPGTTLDVGATEPNLGVQLFGLLPPFAIEESIRQAAGADVARIAISIDDRLHRWIDPSAASQIIFQESNGSPAVNAIDFLADPNIAKYEVWSEIDGTWSAPQTVVAGTTASFSPGVHAFKIEGLSALGQVVALPDGFLFAATFASIGQVNANVASIDLNDFNGTNVQTPIAGQTTLTVSSSFNYTDAGNGTLTVNGTASGNDTLLLGSGDKTVNLGSGADFLMVKDGATGNIVIHGGPGAETILANAANVTLVAGTGDILFTGGDDSNAHVGVNTIDYSALSGSVNVNLATGIVATPNNAITTLVNVENVTGSRFADHLTGDARANVLNGGGGADILTGGAGNDQFVFDAAALTDAKAASPVFDEVTDYSSGDQIDLSALLMQAFNHGNGQTVGSLVRAVEDSSKTFALLQVDTDGSANGANWTTIAKLDGVTTGGSLNVILDSTLPAGSLLSVIPPGMIESLGSTSLTQAGNNYFLYANGTSIGLELKYGGAPWVAGQWGAWTPIGAEATASGYEVAFKTAGANQYTVWNADSNGNLSANPIGTVPGGSLTLEALEASFHQDLNGDGAIGLPSTTTLVEALGSTSLLRTTSNYVFDRGGGGPLLHYDGAAFVAGQWGGWTPIGVEATASGYEVAFKVAGADQYTVWDTDANGNIILDPIGTVSGSSPTLAGLERSFQQDLNGDGMVGNPSIPIPVESFGTTSLVQTGNDYFLDVNATSSGPALKYGGAPWTDGEWGGWTPIGAEATATGYQVAFNLAGTSQYTVWSADLSGNITTNTIGSVAAGSSALVALETGFHQDLNGDGIIGDPSIPFAIETSGSTSLTQLGHNFFLYAHGTSNGPELKSSGASWTTGQWGGWTPIGAEVTAPGYEVALKLTGSDLYTVWNTDSNGNITSNPIGSVPGANSLLQSIETSFHQDLNGDGVIGPPSHTGPVAPAAPITAPTSGNAILSGTAAADTFIFNAHFGNDTVTGFQPGVDQVEVDHTLFPGVSDLFTHTADNAGGSAVVTVAADQSITIDGISKALLQQHASDFHLI
jgi:Ca2+-binding RTX toxin-like protein